MIYDSTFEAFQANPAIPCPLCGKPDWCYLKSNAKGVVWWAVCGRSKEAPEGWERVGTSKGADRRGIFQIQGISHRRRKFPQDFQLKPQDFADFPEWQRVSKGEAAIAMGDRVLFDGEVVTVEGIQSTKSSKKFNYKLSNGHTVDERLVTHADHDPKTGDHEQAVTYIYDAQHKVARRQWTDRRPWYDGKTKEVRPWHSVRGEDGSWVWKIGRGPKDEAWPIYHQAEILEAIATGKPWFVVGGEECADTLRRLGFFATCCQGGEGRWLDVFEMVREAIAQAKVESPRKSIVILWPDNDPTGQTTLSELHRRLTKELNAKVCMINPLELWQQMPAGGDAVDWLKANQGMAKEDLIARLQKVTDNAIDRQELRIEAEDRADSWGAPTLYKNELGFWHKRKIDGEEVEIWVPACNFDVQVLQEIHGDDGGGFILGVTLTDSVGEKEVRILAQDCESKAKFQRALSRGLGRPVICKLKDEHIQALLRVRLLEYSQIQGGKSYRLVKKMGCQGNNPDGTGIWVFPNLQLTHTGQRTTPDQSGYTWDDAINDGGDSVQSPITLDHDPNALANLIKAARVFFGDNFPRVLLCMGWGAACCHYQALMKIFDAFPIINPHGDPGGGKTEAIKVAMALAGNHRAGMLSGVTVSAVYEILKISGNLPLCWDDPEESDQLDELLKRLYNAKARLTRGDGKRFASQKPNTSIAVPTNAAIGENQAATQSRLVKVFFPPITGGTTNTETYEALQEAMDKAAGGLPDIIRIGVPKDRIRELANMLQPHLELAHNRLSRSFAVFLAYAEQLQVLADCQDIDLMAWTIKEIAPSLNTMEESGDSVRDFLEKVGVLLSASKIGPWNCRVVQQRDGAKSLAIQLTSVWDEVKNNYKVSYNRTSLKALLESRGAEESVQRFHTSKEESRDYARLTAQLRFQGGKEEDIPPTPMRPRKCHTIPMDVIEKYAEISENLDQGGNLGNLGNSEPETESGHGVDRVTFLGNSDLKKGNSGNLNQAKMPITEKEKPELPFSGVTQTPELPFLGNSPNPYGVSDTGQKKAELPKLPKIDVPFKKNEGEVKSTVTRAGDKVVIDATATRIAAGSDPLPLDPSSKWAKGKKRLRLEDLEKAAPEIWKRVQDVCVVVSARDGRVKVKDSEGMLHTFDAQYVHVLEAANP